MTPWRARLYPSPSPRPVGGERPACPRSSPAPAECSAKSFDFGTLEGRCVEAAFDAGLVASDTGALLLGAADRAICMIDRFASCFHDERHPQWIEHEVATLVGLPQH